MADFRLVFHLLYGPAYYPLTQEKTLIGSAVSCAIRIVHPSVSRHHATVEVNEHGEVWLKDLDSTNGTFVEGERLATARRISSDERLTFGKVSSVLEKVPDGDAQPVFRLPGGDESTGPQESASGITTFTESFTLMALPEVLRDLNAGRGQAVVAQRLGAAIWHYFPTTRVELRSRAPVDALPWFRAGEVSSSDAGPSRSVEAEDEHIYIRASVYPPSLADALSSVLEVALQLIALARNHEQKVDLRRPAGTPPPLPAPPTVEPRMLRIYQQGAKVAAGRLNILILGESGTGKEVLARYLHEATGCPPEAFIALNCAALPRDLLEAELFGIEKGVATGVAARAGCFELANGGTLFLDEIGDMALETQAKILRVLQERTVYRLGGAVQARDLQIRVLAATNRDLQAMVEDGSFRGDLYYRLAGWEVHLLPLRERRQDILNLSAHFLQQAARTTGLTGIGISQSAFDALVAHDWPGNIRELQHEISRCALQLGNGDLLETRHLRREVREAPGSKPTSLQDSLDAFERQCLERAVEESRGQMTRAAEILKISRSTLYRRMRALGLTPGETEQS